MVDFCGLATISVLPRLWLARLKCVSLRAREGCDFGISTFGINWESFRTFYYFCCTTIPFGWLGFVVILVELMLLDFVPSWGLLLEFAQDFAV